MNGNDRQEQWSQQKRFMTRFRSGGPPAVLLALLASSLLLRCANTDSESSLYSRQVAETGGAATIGVGGTGGSPFRTGSGGLTIQLVAGAGGQLDAGRTFSCTPKTVERDCPLPRSTCGGAGSLAYYTDPVCVQNACQWTRHTTLCDRACNDGGCLPSFTAVPIGPIDAGTECAAADASACTLPPSVCLDDSNLLYFTNPRCVEGACRTDALVRACSRGCNYGGCRYPLTLAH